MLKHLYTGWQDIDARILKQYRHAAEIWEARGHGSYGLSLIVQSFTPSCFGLSIPDTILNWTGFLLTTTEPQNSLYKDMMKYVEQDRQDKISFLEYIEKCMSRVYIASTTPLRFIAKRFIDSSYDELLTSDGEKYNPLQTSPLLQGFQTVNRHLRLPLLIASGVFLGRELYEVADSYLNNTTNGDYQNLRLGMGFLATASSAYFKDKYDSSLGKKQKSLQALAQEAWEVVKEKISIKIPRPIHARSLEEIIQ